GSGGGGEDPVQHFHVGDRVGRIHRNRGVLTDRPGEQLCLDAVLVGGRDVVNLEVGVGGRVTAGVVDDPGGSVVGNVERDLHHQAPGGAFDRHPLVVFCLGRDREHGVAAVEVEDRRGDGVGAEGGILADERFHVGRLGVEDEPGDVHRVATDVVEGATARPGDVADVGRVHVAIGEHGLDGVHLAYHPFVDHALHLYPLRVVPVHERFHQLH